MAWSHGTWAYTGTGTAEDPYVINGSNTATNWTDLKTVMGLGGYIRLDANCTDGTKSSDSYLDVPLYITVVLDLHGKTINRNLTSAIENGFVIKNSGYLTINDSGTGGTIKGGFNTGYGGGIYNIRRKITSTYTGTVEINGGTITGNKASDGGGIYDKYEGATSISPSFTINGGSINNNIAEGNGGGIWTDTNMKINSGTISYNTAGGNGGGIYGAQSLDINNCNINHNSATNGGGIYYNYTFFNMYGGSVTNNTASEKGGGILIANNTWGNQDVFFIHGTITVKDNTCGTSANNVHLMSYVYNTLTYNRHININDNLSSSTRIGVTVEGAPRAFTSGLSGHGSTTNFFPDDATAYSVTLDDNNEAFLKKYISSVAITSIEAPSATKSFDTSAYCSTEGVASKSVAWKKGTTTVTGYAVAGNTYTVEVTLTPSSGYEFANTTTATINGNTATVTKSGSNRVVSYTFPQTQKIITTIYTNPTASSITYGQTLANSTLSGGYAIRPDYSTQVSGTFAWTTPTTKPDVGNSQSFEVTFTPSDATNFATATRNVTVTVNKATPTITGTAVATAVYGTLVKDISISGLTATFGSETVSGSWAFSNIPTNNVCPSVGNTATYSASFTPTDNTHFNTVNRNICPTITPKDLTVTANNKTITYGEERDNAGVTYEGFVNSETFSVLGGSLTYTYPKYVNSTLDGSYSAGSPVSDENTIYKIKPSGLTSNNYSITFVDGTLTVAQKEASISWSNTLFTYNGTAQKPTATVLNRVGNDVCTVTVSGEQTNAGSSYIATATALSNANYKLPTTPPTQTFKINKASLTITANDNAITYGDLPTGNGVTYSGFVNNETASVLGGTLGYTFSYAQYGNVGDNYIIVPNGLTSNNYRITFLQGTLTVAQKEATLSWTNTALTYNGTPQKPTATVSNLVNNDYCVVAVSGEQTNASATAYTATATAFNNSNYKLPTADADKQTSFTISKAALTVTANDNAITYGDLPTGSGVTYSGFVNGETASVVGGSLGYTFNYAQYGNVGDDYTITPNGLTSNNYSITFVPGTLTVAQKEATLSWTNTALTYNGTAQKPTAAVSNLVNNDACTVTVSGEQTNASATAYTATATVLDNDNYKLPAEDPDKQTAFTISKAPLTITAKDHSITYGEEGANAGLTYTGFVNGETETTSDLTGTLSFSYCSKSTDALYLAGSDAGDDYWITANGLTSNNYAISFVQGTLTVDPKPLTITAKDQTIEYGKGIAKGTDQVTLSTDLASTDALAEITLTPSTEGYTDDGSATITPSVAVIKRDGVAKTSNYAITYVPGVLKITKKQLKITAKDKAITYGDVASNAGVTYSGFRAGESENTPGLLSGTLKYDYGGYAPGKDVGEYVITPSGLTSPNYYIIYDTGTLTVNKKTVGIAWGETLLTYCDADIAPVAIATGLYGEDQCDVIISGAAKEVGVHQATATGLSNANYQLPQQTTRS